MGCYIFLMLIKENSLIHERYMHLILSILS